MRMVATLENFLNRSDVIDTNRTSENSQYQHTVLILPWLPPKIIPLKPVLIVLSRFFHYLCV
jgi:hypothetical protein